MRWLLLLLALLLGCADDEFPGAGGPGADGGVIAWRPDGSSRPPADGGGPRDAADAAVMSPDGGGPAVDGGDGGVPADAGPDPCTRPPAMVVTASAAAAGGELVDQVVEVRGRLEAGEVLCSDESCPPDRPCCQACSAPVRLDGVLELVEGACAPFSAGCRGDNCSLTCSPPLLGVPSGFRGRVLSGGGLEVFEVLP